MPKRKVRHANGGKNEGQDKSGVASKERSGREKKAKKQTNAEEGRVVVRGKRPQTLTGESPDRPRRSLSSLLTPNAAAPARPLVDPESETAINITRKRRRSKDLGIQLEAAAEEGNEQVDLEINSQSHKIRLVITSPARKKISKTRSYVLHTEEESEELPKGKRRSSLQGGESNDAGSKSESSPAPTAGQLDSHEAVPRAEAAALQHGSVPAGGPQSLPNVAIVPLPDFVSTPIAAAFVPATSLSIAAATSESLRTAGSGSLKRAASGSLPLAASTSLPLATSGSLPRAATGSIALTTTPHFRGTRSTGTSGPAPQDKNLTISAGTTAPLSKVHTPSLGVEIPISAASSEFVPQLRRKSLVESPSPDASSSHALGSVTEITFSPAVPCTSPVTLASPGFPEFVEPEVLEVSKSVESNPPSASPISTLPQLRTPACVDRTSPQSRESHPPNPALVHVTNVDTVAQIPTAPSSPTAEPSSPVSPSSLVARCSIRPQPYPKSPSKKTMPLLSRPPKSPKLKRTDVTLDSDPVRFLPNIANRTNPPAGESLRDMVVKSSVKSLLRSFTVEERAAFIEANKKLCEKIVVGANERSKSQRATKTKRGCKKGGGGSKKEGCSRKNADAAMKQKVQAEKRKEIPREEKGKGPIEDDDNSDLNDLAQIEVLINRLQAQKEKITSKRSPSPRESSKGQQSRPHIKEAGKLKQVGTGKVGGRDLSSDSSNPVACPSSSGSMLFSDPLSLGTWDVVRDVPPCEVNSMAHPVGQFWRHMKNFAFERAAFTFPWHVDWSQQDSLTKVRFKLRLKKLYPGDWDDTYVMQMVGNNIRERRVRLRRSFAKANSKNSVPVVGGVTVESWNAIFDSLSDAKYQAKSDKCKVAADERTKKKGFTHKLGPRGVQGLVTVFMDEFDRQPTEKEVLFAKQNGIQAAVDHVRHGSIGGEMQEAVPEPKRGAKQTKGKGKKRDPKPTSEDEDSAEDDEDDSSDEKCDHEDDGDNSSDEEGDHSSNDSEDGTTDGSGDEDDTGSEEDTSSEADDGDEGEEAGDLDGTGAASDADEGE